jgi:hypothetical protein
MAAGRQADGRPNRPSGYPDDVLTLALSTPGNVTTTLIAAVALLVGVVLMVRGRRAEAATGTASSTSDSRPATARPAAFEQQSTADQGSGEPVATEPAAAEPAVAEPAPPAAEQAPPWSTRIRLGGARFGHTAGPSAESVPAEPAAVERASAEPAASEPAAPSTEPAPPGAAPPEVDTAPAEPRRIRLGGARFGHTVAPGAAPDAAETASAVQPSEEAALAQPADAPLQQHDDVSLEPPEEAPAQRIRLGGARFGAETSEPPAPPEPPAPEPPEPPAPPAPEPQFETTEEALAKPRRIRLGGARFGSTMPQADAAAPTAPAPADEPAPLAESQGEWFRPGTIRLRG